MVDEAALGLSVLGILHEQALYLLILRKQRSRCQTRIALGDGGNGVFQEAEAGEESDD